MELLLLDFSPQLRLAHEPVERGVRPNANSSCTTIVSPSKLADIENPVVCFLYFRILLAYDTAVSVILVVFRVDCILNETSQNIEINFGDIAQKGQFIF